MKKFGQQDEFFRERSGRDEGFGQQDEFFRERSGQDDEDETIQPYVLSRTSTIGYEDIQTLDITIHRSTNESNLH